MDTPQFTFIHESLRVIKNAFWILSILKTSSKLDSMDMNLNKFWEMVKDRGACHPTVHGVKKSWTQLSYWTTTKFSQFSCSVVSDSATLWTAAHQASLSVINSQSLLKLMSIELVMPSNHLPLSSPSPPAFNLAQHQGFFQWVSSLHQVAKVLELKLQPQSFQWIFKIDFL